MVRKFQAGIQEIPLTDIEKNSSSKSSGKETFEIEKSKNEKRIQQLSSEIDELSLKVQGNGEQIFKNDEQIKHQQTAIKQNQIELKTVQQELNDTKQEIAKLYKEIAELKKQRSAQNPLDNSDPSFFKQAVAPR